MAISPADFYAYSRATGVQIPEDPEERARMAPDVLQFRRNQLKAPEKPSQEGFGLSQAVALGAGLATLGLAGLGARRAFTGAPATTAGLTEETLRRSERGAMTASPELARIQNVRVASPVGESKSLLQDLNVKPSLPPSTTPGDFKSFSQDAEKFSPRGYLESTGAVESADLTSVQQTQLPSVAQQSIEATDGGLDQVIQRNVTAPSQRDTDFLKFSENASVITEQNNRVRAVADQIWGFEEELENLGLQAQAWLQKPNAKEFATQAPARGIGYEDMYERISAAASDYKVGTMVPLSAIERADLLDADIPTQKVKYLLGNTLREQGGRVSTNLTYEVPAGAGITEKGAESIVVTGEGSDVVAFNPRTGQYETDYVADLEDINTGVKNFSNYEINAADYGDVEGPGGFVETRTFTERTKSGQTQVPGQVNLARGAAPGSERMERELDVVLPSRSTLEGDVARGYTIDAATGKLTFVGGGQRGTTPPVLNVAGKPVTVVDTTTKRARPLGTYQGAITVDDPSYDPTSGGKLTGRLQPATSEPSALITTQPVTGFLTPRERLIQDPKGNWFVNQAKTKVTGSKDLVGFVGSDPNLRKVSLQRDEVNNVLSNAAEMWSSKGGGSALDRQTFLITSLDNYLQTSKGIKLPLLQPDSKGRIAPAAFSFINDVQPGLKETSIYVKPAKVDASGRPLVQRQTFGTGDIRETPLIDPQYEGMQAMPMPGKYKYSGAGGVAAREVDTETYEGAVSFFSPTSETAPQRVLPGGGRPPAGEQGSVISRPYLDTPPVGYQVKSPGSFARTQNPYTGAAAAAMGPASRVLSGNYQYPQQQLSFRLEPTSQSQLMQRNLFALTANTTPGGRVVRGGLLLGGGMGAIPAGVGTLSESETITRYGASGSQLQEVGNRLMAQAARKRGVEPGPTGATPPPQQGPVTPPMQAPAPASVERPTPSSTEMAGYARRPSTIPDVVDPVQARNDAIARHIGNYISAASERLEGPASIQGVKMRGVGQNALRPYQAPSEAMIQQLMRAARRR